MNGVDIGGKVGEVEGGWVCLLGLVGGLPWRGWEKEQFWVVGTGME